MNDERRVGDRVEAVLKGTLIAYDSRLGIWTLQTDGSDHVPWCIQLHWAQPFTVPAALSVSTDHTDEKPGQQQAINVALTAFYASPANEHTRHAVRAAVEAAYPVIARAVLQDFLDNYTKGLAGRG